MNIHLTLDYEMFFGERTGTVENCMIRPTNRLRSLLEPRQIRATFYVDVGYLERARRLDADGDNLGRVKQHLKELSDAGHDLQLHIHPHWEDAQFVEDRWRFDVSRYRLADFDAAHAADIIGRYVKQFADAELTPPVAYRAGGWCIQPFSHFADALTANGIRLDSTIFYGGRTDSEIQGFDFRTAPRLNSWSFSADPLTADADGAFLELPISEIRISPLYFWRFAAVKMWGGKQHAQIGDGAAISMTGQNMIRLLSRPSTSVASIDGYKSSLLGKAYRARHQQFGDRADLVLIGHPKALTAYSLDRLATFLDGRKADRFMTASEWYEERLRELRRSEDT